MNYNPNGMISGNETPRIEKAPPWLISFGDVTALMLTFFVMLFSMQEVQSEKWDAVVSTISTSLTPKDKNKIAPTAVLNISTVSIAPSLPVDYLSRILSDKLKKTVGLGMVRIQKLDNVIILSFPEFDMFDGKTDKLTQIAEEMLPLLASNFTQFGNQIDVVGHTDPDVPDIDLFSNNWELSLARALTIGIALNEGGYVGNFTFHGMGDSRFRHINPSLSEAQRYKIARRVDIVIHTDAGGQ
jgi:chemotaxis protein MotB